MKKTFTKLLALLLCLFVFSSGINVHASETNQSGTNQEILEDTNTDTNESDESVSSEPENPEPEPELEPLSLNGKLSATRTIKLTWKANDASASYQLRRSASKTGTYKTIKNFSGKTGTISYSDKELTLGNTYYYQLREIADDTIVNQSPVIAVKVRLLSPINVKTSVNTSNDVTLSWSKVHYTTSYVIYRSTSKTGTYKKIAAISKTSYTDTSTISAMGYYYKIYAYRKGNPSARSLSSTIVSAYTKPLKTTLSAKYTSGKVKLSWTKVNRATKYYIYRTNSNGKYECISSTSKLYFYDDDAKVNNRYKYIIRAAFTKDDQLFKGPSCSPYSIYTAKIDPDKKMVALTFDDGPGPYTQAIVNCLKKYDSRATFFVVGNRVNSYKSVLKSTYDNGNEIANHTYSHPTLTSLSTSSIKSQISKTDSRVKAITGESTALMRAPGGGTNSRVRNAIDKPFIYWSIDTLDWKHRNKTKTVNTVLNNVSDGDIILMHDIHSPSKAAALELIPKLKKKGYQLVTVSELAQYRGYKLKDHTTYYSLD